MQEGFQKPEDYIGHHSPPDEVHVDEDERYNLRNPETDEDWVALARNSYQTSTDYFDSNIREQLDKNVSLFQSKHPSGSKYYTESYKYRSKIFRPKVRSMIRRHEAAAAMAFFGTIDPVVCTAEDPGDKSAESGAEMGQNWLTYRLEHTIPWFKTLIGGYQDAMTTGVVISRQEWEYEEEEFDTDEYKFDNRGLVVLDEKTGVPVINKGKSAKPLIDRPNIDLVPVENFRFASGADWRDPVNTSPFLIELVPMFLCDVKARMGEGFSKDDPTFKWYRYSDDEIRSATQTGEYDTIRMTREGKREDSKDQTFVMSLYDIVWVHRNIVKVDDEDMLYYTLGTEFLLSDPVPLTDVYAHGRPYVVGNCVFETHKIYPSGLPELAQDLINEANDLANQRLDNIKLILNKRYKARRGTNTDWKALTTSVPGGVILLDDLNDIEEESFQDVTKSAYLEQDRVNADFDELVGSFSVGSVQNNRNLNETVGGMSMALDDSNIITEYQLRVFAETWIEPVLKQLLELGRKYETDERVLSLIGKGVTPDIVSELMNTEYNVRVNVGFGSTSPQKRVERLTMGVKTLGEISPEVIQKLNIQEITKEIFGAMGYRDGSRFVLEDKGKDEDPKVKQLEQKIQELSQMLDKDKVKADAQVKIAQIKDQGDTQREQLKLQARTEIHNLDIKIAYIKEQIAAEKNDIARGELILEQEALQFQKKQHELSLLTDQNNRLSEVLMRDQYGLVPAAEG